MRILLVLLAFSVGLFAQGNYVIPQLLGSGQTAVQPSINPGVQGSCPNWQMSTPVIATDAAHGNRLIATQPSSESKRIVIFGSSSARGVGASVCISTSWAIAFRDAMKARGYEVINVSKEGDNSTALLNRFFTDVAPLQPDFVILAGSIYNDGGPTAGNVNFHEQSVHRLIKMVESVGAIPVIMGQFPNNGYTVAQYQMVEDLYMQWEKLGVQVWDFMSTLVDPTTGHYISQISSADGTHPDDTGHALMFQSIPLGYFDVARTPRATNFSQGNQSWQWGSDTTNIPLKVTPFPSMASFTAIAWIKDATGMGSALLSSDRDSTNPLRIRSNSSTGVCELVDGGTTIAASTVSCSSGLWHHHAVSFNSATNKAAYYIDGVLIGTPTTLTRSGFNTSNVTFLSRFDSAGGNCVGCQLAEPMVYRVSLQAQDVVNIYNGHPLRKSLEYYSTLGSTPGGAFAPNLADTGTQGTLGSATQWSVIGTFSVSSVLSSRLQNASVTDFGAKGDGTTDNSTAFAKASAWASAVQGRTLTCPDGTFVYSSGLSFTVPTTFKGSQGCVLNYTGTADAIDLGSAASVSSVQYTPYVLEGFKLTGGASMTQGIYVYPYVVNTLFKDLVLSNFGNASAWNIYYQANNWYNVIDGMFMYANTGFARAWNGVRLNGATAVLQDNGVSRLNITNSIIQNFDFATTPGTGVYLNGAQCSLTDSTIAGFAPHVQIGNYGHSVVLRHNWLESSHNLTSYLIEFGDPSGIGYGSFIGGVEIQDNVLVPHQADQFPNFKVIGPVSGTQVFNGVRLLNNTIITLVAGTPIVTENNLTGYNLNFAQNNLLMTCISCGSTSAAGSIHSTGSNIPVWSGSDGDGLAVTGTVNSSNGDIATFTNGVDSGGSVSIKVGKTAQEYATLSFRDFNGSILGGLQASGSGLANRMSLLGPGNVLGAQVLSTGLFSIPTGIDASGGGMKLIIGQALGCSTAASVGSTCTTSAISFAGTAFPNTSYALSCTLSSTSGVPTIVGVTKGTSSFTLTVAALTASIASGSVDCVATHQ